MMGSNDGYADEQPVHQVTVPSFYIGEFPVTQQLYKEIMGANPSYFKGARRPVERISWHDAKSFIATLNEQLNKDFRLPSESEWEYTARGGQNSKGYEYVGSDDLKQVAWYDGNSRGETKPVGLLLPNELSLYDMTGNVWEWCEDDWHDSYKKAPNDGSAWVDTTRKNDGLRVVRGGSCLNTNKNCRSASRFYPPADYNNSEIGFRLVIPQV